MDTIKSSADISELFANGKRLKSSFLTLIVKQRPIGENQVGIEQHDPSGRVAFIAGKKQGNAVWRNAAKRRMRAVCRELGGPWDGYDVVFLAKSSIMGSSYSKVLKACDKALTGSALSEGKLADE